MQPIQGCRLVGVTQGRSSCVGPTLGWKVQRPWRWQSKCNCEEGTPKVFNHPAQGCAQQATLGHAHKMNDNPAGGCISLT